MKRNVKIVVMGGTATGKSSIASFIMDALIKNGFNDVSLCDVDGGDFCDFKEDFQDAINSLSRADRLSITIETKQVNRKFDVVNDVGIE